MKHSDGRHDTCHDLMEYSVGRHDTATIRKSTLSADIMLATISESILTTGTILLQNLQCPLLAQIGHAEIGESILTADTMLATIE